MKLNHDKEIIEHQDWETVCKSPLMSVSETFFFSKGDDVSSQF